MPHVTEEHQMIITLLTSFSFFFGDGPVREATCTWYGQDFHGRLTSCGEVYDINAFTTAHLSYPTGTIFLMWRDGRSSIVIKNDTGPFVEGVDFDLSMAAFKMLAPCWKGRIRVNYIVIGRIVRPSMLYNLGVNRVQEAERKTRGDTIERA